MARRFAVWADLHANTAEAEAKITRSFDRLTEENKRAQGRIRAAEKKHDAEREKRSKARRQAVRRGAFGLAGGIAAAAVTGAKDTLEFERVLAGVQIQAGASAEKMAEFQRALVMTSRKTAISRQELARAAETLTNLLGPAAIKNSELLDLVARTAVATGADIQELGGLVSAVSDSMGIAVEDTANMERALSAFVRAGKEGKIPLSEMSVVLQDVSSTFARVGAGGVKSAADVSAALQVLRKSTGSAAKAGTVLEAGISSLVQKSDKFKKAGIKVFIGTGPEKRLRSMRDILDQIAAKGLNIKQLQDILGRKEAVKFFETLQDPEARREFERLSAAAAEATDISTDFGKRTETQGFRIAKAMNDAKLAIGEAMTPERIEAFVKLLQGAVDGAGWLADGFVSVGTAIGESVFELEDFLFGTRETLRETAMLRSEIRALKKNLAEQQALIASQRQQSFELAQQLAALAAADSGVVTRDVIAQKLEQQGVIGPELDVERAGFAAPAVRIEQEAREAAITEAMAQLSGTLDKLVEQGGIQGQEKFSPELLEQIRQVRLDPATIRELNQGSFARAQRALPSLPAGTR